MTTQSNLINTSPQKRFLPISYSGDYETTIANITLSVGGIPTVLEIPLPVEKVTAEAVLPLFQALTNFLVEISVKTAEKEGKEISCQKGCGACCSQLVPITNLEVGYLKKIVSEMPESQQITLHEKFKQATQLLEEGTLEKIKKRQSLDEDQRIKLGLDYFQLNIPCPFLENQSCSIHPHRPMACREYLVTSAVKHCSAPQLEKIEGIKIPSKVSHAVSRLMKQKKNKKRQSASWFPLILLMEPQSKPVKKQKLKTGADWLKDILTAL